MYSFPDLEPVCFFLSTVLTVVSWLLYRFVRSQVVWYSHLLKNFPQFVVIHTVKCFGVVNNAEVDVFLELSCVFDDPMDVVNLAGLSIWSLCHFEHHTCGKRIEAHLKFWSPVLYYQPDRAYSFRRSQRQSVGVQIWVHCSFVSQWGWVSVAKWDSGNCRHMLSSFSPEGV